MRLDIHEATQGRWRGILASVGLSQKELSGKHCPCPICGGVDRFRFDDKAGRGTWFCTHCGAGSGVDLVMKIKGWDFREAMTEVRALVGVSAAEPIKAGMSDDDKRALRLSVWNASVPIQRGDMADQYFASREIDQGAYPKTLRFCPSCRYSADQSFPALIAAVQDLDGKAITLHRTFLKDGAKAPVDSPRMLMPGTVPSGSAVRLSAPTEVLGIAEGIETALAASDWYSVPVWAALNASLLAEWEPPEGVTEVVIFGDNDANFVGQSAAYQLARRLSKKNLTVSVHIPPDQGTDWNDVVLNRKGKSK